MKVYTPDLGQTEMEVDEFLSLPEVESKLTQALVRLMARDRENNLFRFLLSDEIGSLRVTNASPLLTLAETNSVSVLATLTTLFNRNNTRKWLLIQNIGLSAFYVKYEGMASGTNGIYLDVGDSWYDDAYTGLVQGISPSGTSTARINQLVARI